MAFSLTAKRMVAAAAVAAAAFFARDADAQPAKALVPVPPATVAALRAKDVDPSAPILIRSFKKESELEVWKLARTGRYVHVKTFPICRWSGQLGPKQRTGDRQAPEGFYAVAGRQMNPNSAYHLSFDLGYPNAYDRAHGATGAYLMTHGICSSMGCYAMTNDQISEIYALARDALASGQRAFQFQAYPFRMTAAAMARARSDQHIAFWRQLKEGYDRFEATGEELTVGVREGRYTFAPSRNPAREAAAQSLIAAEADKVAALVADGIAAVRITYSDGGMHARFASLSRQGVSLGEVSRPEALALAGREIVLIPARRKAAPATAVAAAPSRGEMRPSPVALGPAAPNVAMLFWPVALSPALPSAGAERTMAGSAAPILPSGSFGGPAPRLALRGA